MNHAQLGGTLAPSHGHVSFLDPGDQLIVPVKNDSLQRFTALRVESLIYPTISDRRLNIVEGLMSFALVIEHNGSLIASIYDGHTWVAVDSGLTKVPLNTWSRVAFEYDGICIGRISLNGSRVGLNTQMPMGMYQPRQNITIGHWPSGDGRYTFHGQIGHTTVDRRDHEDFARDAWATALCGRRLTPRQVDALRELDVLLHHMDQGVKQRLVDCAKARSERLLKLLRDLRAGDMRVIVAQQRLGAKLLAAWCCDQHGAAYEILLEHLRVQTPRENPERRARFFVLLNALLDISRMCEIEVPDLARIRDLVTIIIPELRAMNVEMKQIAQII